jgi:hypothetical protein
MRQSYTSTVDEAFRQLVLVRFIESVGKACSLRVIKETGVAPVSYPTLNRRLAMFAKPAFRQAHRPRVPLTPGWRRPVWSSTT